MKKYFLKTFGCQMNYSDSEKLESVLESIALEQVERIEESDIVIFNTCSIKQHAEDRVFGYVRNAKKLGKIVGLTGCMVRKTSTQHFEKDEKDSLLKKFERIDFVFRIEDMKSLPELLQEYDENIQRPKISFDELDYLNISPKLKENFRAFVPIMTGCDKFCTYCIVPFARGKERSRPFADIVNECEMHVKNGVKEITLVGQNVNAYFLDDSTRKTLQRQTDFAILLDEIAQIKNLKRLQFTSPHPRHMGQDVIDVMVKNENIARTLHLPVQSGSTKMLQKMGREHNISRFTDFTKNLRKAIPEITITTDIIVGFCDETEEDFQETMKLFNSEKFIMAYISKYSVRKGTIAGDKMKDTISLEEKKRRFELLTEKLKEVLRKENKKEIGKIEEVLVDEVKNGIASGKSHRGRTIRFPIGEKNKRFIGEIISVKIISSESIWSFTGEMM